MTENRTRYGFVPTNVATDHGSSQETSQHHRDLVITSLPPLRPSNSAPRRSYATHSQTIGVHDGDNYSLCGTYDHCQPTTSWAAAKSPPRAPSITSVTYKQNLKISSARDSIKTSCSPIRPPSSFSLPVDPNQHANLTGKPHSDARSSPSTEYMPVPQPATSSSLRKSRNMPRLEARTSNDVDIRTQNSHGSLFVEQGDPARGSSFLDYAVMYFPAPSSPLRIPSSPSDDHIGNLRVAAKLESRSYQTGFFPEANSFSTHDSVIDEDEVTVNTFAGTRVSGFILEDDDSDNSDRKNKITPEAGASDRGVRKSKLKQTEHTKPAVIGDDVGISNHRSSQASWFPSDLEHATTPQDTTPESHFSLKDFVSKSKRQWLQPDVKYGDQSSQAFHPRRSGAEAATSPSNTSPRVTPSSWRATTSDRKPKVLNQRRVDPSTLGLIPIKTLPGPLYEEQYPVTKFANTKYSAETGSMPSSPIEKDARAGLRMGRRRSRTLPSPHRAGALDRGIAAASAAHHSRGLGTGSGYRGSIPSQLLNDPKESNHIPTGDYCPPSKHELYGRHRQAREPRGPVPQPDGPRTPIRKGGARVQPGRNSPLSEKQLVGELRFSNGWPDRARKRRVSSFRSPKSIQEDGPEKKRVRDKRFEPETAMSKRQTTGRQDPTGFFQPSNVESRSVMRKHNVNIASSSSGTSVTCASGTDSRLIDRQHTSDGYAESVEDHVKTLHRSMGPMKKRRLGGLAQLKVQRELKKERPDECPSKPSDTTDTTSRTKDK
ncbi:uncharacterized protein LY79DRAFT_697393 [Colletotrichum navitas]|uniref:Uncharacterized protein n=1 Tax=Colletotrichum navitas TaxID=681940 RepID=A0AAD8Q7K9_9PEZI|nr:uncharacterized protein LY79DRAFT_697393 [Colletotrichum navitas]KAK1597190.1 hypothetical protein LY79DRAFT_697393 [Colletotrichum navitas]